MLLLEHMARHGLTVGVLDPLLFPQGQIFHRKKAIMQSFVDGTERPYVFHMCWTAGRTDKLRYLKNMALWPVAVQKSNSRGASTPSTRS